MKGDERRGRDIRKLKEGGGEWGNIRKYKESD